MNVVFNKNWFSQHQSKLIWLLNNRFLKGWFRWVLCIDNKEFINRIEPNAYWFGAKKKGKQIEVKADFRTHDKYSKRLYFAFSPLWYAMHIWDLFADNYIPKLSFGFDTLTAYPSAGDPGTLTVDGLIYYDPASPATWAAIRSNASGTAVTTTAANDGVARLLASTTSNRWDSMRRGIFLFDTSSLTASATISAATFSLFGTFAINAFSQAVGIVSSAPASNTTLATGDYSSLGTTRYNSSDITIASWSTVAYNNFAFNATGISNVSKTSITKLGTKLSGDLDNTEPTWSSGVQANVGANYADATGTTNDPQLVVTYTTVIPSTSDFLQLFGGPQPQQ